MKKLLLLLLVCLPFMAMAQEPEADANGYIVRVGQLAPDFVVTTTDGESVT